MNYLAHYAALLVIPTVILLHLYVAPYTKVEESFNIQAIHDIITYGVDGGNGGWSFRPSQQYDHMTFPGAVPRSFVGAMFLAQLAKAGGVFARDGLSKQLLVRGILGVCNACALLYMYRMTKQAFGRVAGYWYIAFQASQFHVMFYASRTLPNMIAFVLSTLALGSYIGSSFGFRPQRARLQNQTLVCLTVAGVIIRSELAILLGTISLSFLFIRKASLLRIISVGLACALFSVTLTVLVDSLFWQRRFLWPEWEAFYFNTILGKSSEWGTSPWHYYFSSAIPRLMLNPMTLLVCVPVALALRQTRSFCLNMLTPILSFVAMFSFLPHKEWRFIIYIVPSLTAVAAAGASHIWMRRTRSLFHRALSFALLASVAASFAASTSMLLVSSMNYPGAEALERLHRIGTSETTINNNTYSAHLGNLACQTGVTRFLQLPSQPSSRHPAGWLYDKSEPLESLDPEFWAKFDYALVESGTRDELVGWGTWETLETVNAFAGVQLVHIARDSEVVYRRRPDCLLSLTKSLWHHVQRLSDTTCRWLRQHVTGGRWPALRLEPRIFVVGNTARPLAAGAGKAEA